MKIDEVNINHYQ